MKSILDPAFKYTSAVATDLRRTFKRVRRQQQRDLTASNVRPIVTVTRPARYRTKKAGR